MQISGKHELDLDRDTVWRELNNYTLLEQCIPGCEVLEPTEENEYRIKLLAKVGPIKTRFNGTICMTEIQPPDSYKLVFTGSGGSAGNVKGETQFMLKEEAGNKTILDYDSNVTITGKLAQIGTKLIDGAAKSYANEFFTNFVSAARQETGGEATTGHKTERAKAFSVLDLLSRKQKIAISATIIIILLIAGLLLI